MNFRSLAAALTLLLAALAPAALGHHSVAVNFDQSSEVTVEGILKEMRWRNPHSHFRLDVTTEDGSTVEWLVEMGALNTMRRAGFSTEVFTVGESMSITGWPGRRERVMYLLELTLEDGTRLICAGASCERER